MDDGEHTDDFVEWSAYFQVKQDREAVLQMPSKERIRHSKEEPNNKYGLPFS